MYVCGYACHGAHIEFREQLVVVSSLLPPCGAWGYNSWPPAWLHMHILYLLGCLDVHTVYNIFSPYFDMFIKINYEENKLYFSNLHMSICNSFTYITLINSFIFQNSNFSSGFHLIIFLIS